MITPDKNFFDKYGSHFHQLYREITSRNFERSGLIPRLDQFGKDLPKILTTDSSRIHPPLNVMKVTNMLGMYLRYVQGKPLILPSRQPLPHELEEYESYAA